MTRASARILLCNGLPLIRCNLTYERWNYFSWNGQAHVHLLRAFTKLTGVFQKFIILSKISIYVTVCHPFVARMISLKEIRQLCDQMFSKYFFKHVFANSASHLVARSARLARLYNGKLCGIGAVATRISELKRIKQRVAVFLPDQPLWMIAFYGSVVSNISIFPWFRYRNILMSKCSHIRFLLVNAFLQGAFFVRIQDDAETILLQLNLCTWSPFLSPPPPQMGIALRDSDVLGALISTLPPA